MILVHADSNGRILEEAGLWQNLGVGEEVAIWSDAVDLTQIRNWKAETRTAEKSYTKLYIASNKL
jgi:hypothetical protein